MSLKQKKNYERVSMQEFVTKKRELTQKLESGKIDAIYIVSNKSMPLKITIAEIT